MQFSCTEKSKTSETQNRVFHTRIGFTQCFLAAPAAAGAAASLEVPASALVGMAS